MPRAPSLTMEFQPALDDAKGGKELRDGLSAALQVGRSLWVANDESSTLERLTLAGPRAAGHVQFALADLLDLPVPGRGPAAPEVDIEGLDQADGFLWLVGSHSWKRSKPDQEDGAAAAIRQLADTDRQANRFLLARIPLDDEDGLPVPVRKAGARRSQSLRADTKGNELTRLLRKDRHLAPFIGLPGKENGFDVEGLAVRGDRVFLGLRGPVLRGWAVVLELRVEGKGKRLELRRVDGPAGKGKRVRKHFLDLGGLGIRDLCRHGEDLLVLAGPTMGLSGPVRVLRWRDALCSEDACLVPAEALDRVLEVPFGDGCDHAEGLALLDDARHGKPRLLVVHDSPCASRQVGPSSLRADLHVLRPA